MKLEFYPEYTDQTHEVYHNHFDCPNCNTVKASTDIYICMNIEFEDKSGSFRCEECGAEFKLIHWHGDYTYNEWEWEMIIK